ncbi:VOC family protein [Pseudoxanthomonas sp. PXM04]|jgi:predicted lactoylglutathione lyase|uniref:VOC family protein n=1 Tax=Pseudoxanthomonas sp. PXM04 TaxID=2769297 RepID=UPI001781C4D3|nr:VOC family protein [Pseudoxanthomonas sp. PXM04]MBD9378666.1 VOC family protein [Pseudoxanthomonas sp. PXM04]UBB25448.1 VOC family protein [Pseudoxanthomonas japonensis]
MPTQIFVNIAVSDMARSKAFYEGLGYHFNPQFTNEQGACLVISDTIYVMLLTREFFQGFTDKALSDPGTHAQAILCLSADDRAGVDKLADAAIASGGRQPREPQDHGFMYQRCFEDPDGHLWEVVYMDMAAMQEQEQETEQAS